MPVLTRFPKSSTAQEYADAAAELKSVLTEVPGVVAVYRYGSIAALGISDLDMVAVVEDPRPVDAIWAKLSEGTRYLAMHTPALVDVPTFIRHRWFAEMGGLERVWGESLAFENRPVPEHSEPLLAAEALIVSAVKLAKLSVTGRVKVRPLLCELRNVGLDLRLARIDRAQAPLAWALTDEIERARTEWWDLDETAQRNRLHEIVYQAPAAIANAIEAVGTAHANPSFLAKPMRLGDGWRNVTLVPADGFGDGDRHEWTLPHSLISRSRLFSEALWRSQDREVFVSSSIITMVAGDVGDKYAGFRAQRAELVRRHVEHLAGCPGYSGIASASVFINNDPNHG